MVMLCWQCGYWLGHLGIFGSTENGSMVGGKRRLETVGEEKGYEYASAAWDVAAPQEVLRL
jgi:hypothetical protein